MQDKLKLLEQKLADPEFAKQFKAQYDASPELQAEIAKLKAAAPMNGQAPAPEPEPVPQTAANLGNTFVGAASRGFAETFRGLDFLAQKLSNATGLKRGGAFAEAAYNLDQVGDVRKPAPGTENRFSTNLAEAAGSSTAYMGTMVAGGPLATAAQGFVSQGVTGYYEALGATGDEETAWKALIGQGVVGSFEGLLGAVPAAGRLARVLGRIDKGTNGGARRALLKTIRQGAAAEFGQEMGQGVADPVIATYLLKYREDARELTEILGDVAWKQGLPALAMGGFFGGLEAAASAVQAPPTSRESKQPASAVGDPRIHGSPTDQARIEDSQSVNTPVPLGEPTGVSLEDARGGQTFVEQGTPAAPAEALPGGAGVEEGAAAPLTQTHANSPELTQTDAGPVNVGPIEPVRPDPTGSGVPSATGELPAPESAPAKPRTFKDRLGDIRARAEAGELGFRDWVRARGGISAAHSGDVAGEAKLLAEDHERSKFGLGPLVRGPKSGKGQSLYALVESAMEAGHLPPGSDVTDLLARIESDVTFQKADADAAKGMEADRAALEQQARDEGYASVEEAFAAQPEPEPLKTTGVKKRTVDAELKAMGLPPAQHGESRSDAEVYGVAEEQFGTVDGRERVTRMLDQQEFAPSPMSDDEVALATFEANRLINEREAAQAAFVADPSEANQARIDHAKTDYARFADVVKRSGTESGRAFRMLRMMIARDFSRAAMERAAAVANKGKLSPAQESEIADMHRQIDDLSKKFDEYQKQRESDRDLGKVVEQIKKRTKRPHVREFLSEQADKARARIKARGARASAGLDPADMIDHAIIGADYFAKDLTAFAEWSSAMVKELGDAIKPHLESIYAKSVEVHEEASKDSSRLQGYKTRTENALEKLRTKTAAQDFSKPQRTPIPLDEEALGLKADMEQAKRDYAGALDRYRRAKRTGEERAIDVLKESADIPANIRSSVDFSAVLRQGGVLAVNPWRWKETLIEQIPKMFDASMSERRALKIEEAIKDTDGYKVGKKIGVEFTGYGDTLTVHEENLRSRLAERIPVFGRLVAGSNRAFTTFLNLQRASAVERIVGSLRGSPTKAQALQIKGFINAATGRGNPGRATGFINGLARVLWSPRLLLSRLELAVGAARLAVPSQSKFAYDAEVRKAIAKEYAGTLIGMGAVYALAQLAGADEPEDDMRSSDWGRIKFGDFRLDPMFGLAQITTLVGRIATDTVISDGAEKDANRTLVLFGDHGFLRSKLAPIPGLAWDWWSGKTWDGEEFSARTVAQNSLMPLSFGNIHDAMKAEGVPEKVAFSLLSIFGMGLQHYDERRK